MQCNDVQLVHRLAQVLGYRLGDECVADSMKAIFAKLVLVGYLWVYSVSSDVLGNALVELAIKIGQILGFRQLIVRDSYKSESGRVVAKQTLALRQA